MSATDIPIKPDAEGIEVDPYGIEPVKSEVTRANGELNVVYNVEEGATYLVIMDESNGALHIFKAINLFKNDWSQISPDGGYSTAATEIHNVETTPENAMLISTNEPAIYRSSDWGSTAPNSVHTNSAPLYFKHMADRTDGALYVGGYTGANEVIKSTDDGQTWTQIAGGLTSDDHIHGVAPQHGQDLLMLAWGDANQIHEFMRKDGTDATTTNALGEGGTNYQAVPVMPHPFVEGKGGDDGVFLTGADEANYLMQRCRAAIDGGGTLSFTNQYVIPKLDENLDQNLFCSDLDFVRGKIIGLTRGSQLLVSDDGWFVESIPIPHTGESAGGEISGTMAITDSHIVIPGHTVTIMSKEMLDDIRPTSTTYELFDGSQTGSGTTAFMQELPFWKFGTVYITVDASAAVDMDIRDVVGGSVIDTTVVSLGASGTARGSETPHGKRGIMLTSAKENVSHANMVISRR